LWSLQELGPFARDSGIDEQQFLRELAHVAVVPVEPSAKSARETSWR
jgi:hypothetical protein